MKFILSTLLIVLAGTLALHATGSATVSPQTKPVAASKTANAPSKATPKEQEEANDYSGSNAYHMLA